jgi:hypothetical protein
MDRMPEFKVMVDDNFHYMDEDERSEHGTFATLDAAVAACRALVDSSLRGSWKPGMSADDLYEQYVAFGDDPFIVAPPGVASAAALFSAHTYARERAPAIWAELTKASS